VTEVKSEITKKVKSLLKKIILLHKNFEMNVYSSFILLYKTTPICKQSKSPSAGEWMDKQTQAWPHSRIILSKEELGIATL
jgi:hypothetical protein